MGNGERETERTITRVLREKDGEPPRESNLCFQSMGIFVPRQTAGSLSAAVSLASRATILYATRDARSIRPARNSAAILR